MNCNNLQFKWNLKRLFQNRNSNQITFILSNGHLPQIRENGKLLVRMCRGESHFSQKWPWQMSASLASPRNMAWQMSASLASPRKSAW